MTRAVYQLELENSPPWPMLLLPLGPENWMGEWLAKPLSENIDPIKPLGMLSVDGILAEKESLLEMKSGRSSEDDEDGAKVATEKPTGYGATGMSAREEADGL